MARHTTRSWTATKPPTPTKVHQKYSKLSAPEPTTRPSRLEPQYLSVLHPLKETTATAKLPQPPRRVSTAPIFKKRARDDSSFDESRRHKSHKSRSHRSYSASFREPSLVRDFKDGIEEARGTIDATLAAGFADAYNGYLAKLKASREGDEAFFTTISHAVTKLSVPLVEEEIDVEFEREGKLTTERVKIGKKMAQFKKSVEKDKVRLDDNWKQWEELQNDFIELGLEVFGNEAFGPEQAYEERDSGFKHDMEVVDGDLESGVKELNEEIEDITAKTTMTLKSQEKELEKAAGRDQQILMRLIF